MKSFKQFNEEQELNELFRSLSFKVDTKKWSTKNIGAPSGEGTWKFDYKLPQVAIDASWIDDGIFEFKGSYKKAIKELDKFLKKRGGNMSQAVVSLLPKK